MMKGSPRRLRVTLSDARVVVALLVSLATAYYAFRPEYAIAALQTHARTINPDGSAELNVDGPTFELSSDFELLNIGNRAVYISNIVAYQSASPDVAKALRCTSNWDDLPNQILALVRTSGREWSLRDRMTILAPGERTKFSEVFTGVLGSLEGDYGSLQYCIALSFWAPGAGFFEAQTAILPPQIHTQEVHLRYVARIRLWRVILRRFSF